MVHREPPEASAAVLSDHCRTVILWSPACFRRCLATKKGRLSKSKELVARGVILVVVAQTPAYRKV